MLDAVVDHNGLRHLFRGGVLSVHAASVYKPDPGAYRVAEEALCMPRSEVGFVSSNGWDAAGAKAFGFTVHWVNRGRAPAEWLGVSPDVVVPTLAELGQYNT
jgi:2-haloacid dehalogenase